LFFAFLNLFFLSFICNFSTMATDHSAFKGQPIIFVGGSYERQKGWMDKRFESTPLMHYVIVAPCKKTRNKEKATRVDQANVANPNCKEPTNFVEAMLSQHEDINSLMDKLCKEITKCDINFEKSGKHLGKIFFQKLARAQGRQQARAHKARWRLVVWSKGEY
jgi:hypothetical protein